MEAYGLVGHPLGHSFSAGYFAEKFAREGIDATYSNFDFPDIAQLTTLIAENTCLRGVNVTIPHKQSVIPLLDELSAEAQEIGAVNVVRIKREKDGAVRTKGYNSDVIGFVESLRPLLKSHHSRALVLGSGGASKAVAFGLRKLGIIPTYVSRTKRSDALTYEELTSEVLDAHHVIVNCSPVGMFPHVEEAPNLPYHLLTPLHLCYDLVYNPLETSFMRKASEQGTVVKNGLEMLHLQAEAAWDFWHDGAD
ncbi:MAG: shikimate dehydrogenase [Bacteroidaceae bacterium]|jgi:shikimate dehydrogenase|nr:shikimate dehydrogenase [Bacteroidaceae bacterium]